MAENTTLECPFCHWRFETAPPNSSHVAHSLKRPNNNKALGQKAICPNPRCTKSFMIYWFEPVRPINEIEAIM